MQPENAQKEFSKAVEYFDEEVPPQSYVRCEVRKKQLYAICGGDELPRETREEVGEIEEGADARGERSQVDRGEDDGTRGPVGFGGGGGLTIVAEYGKGRK